MATSVENGRLELFFGPTREFAGQFFVDVFQWLLISGSFACGMAFHNCASRYLYAMGRERFIWKGLGRTHPVHGSPHIASFVQTGIATAVVLAFLADGQDPYLGLYVLMAILGTFAILVVQTLCSFSVIGYFHVQKKHPETASWWKTLLFPLAGGIGMLAVVYLLIDNLTAAAGDASSTVIFKLTPWIVLGTFVIGIALALYLRSARPDRYAAIGRTILEDPGEELVSDVSGDGSSDRVPAGTGARR